MKIIDLLNLKAEGKIEDGFTFAFDDYVWKYNKEKDEICLKIGNRSKIGNNYCLEKCLNDKIYFLKEKE